MFKDRTDHEGYISMSVSLNEKMKGITGLFFFFRATANSGG